jgi:tRNA-dihydrouridine synthase A
MVMAKRSNAARPMMSDRAQATQANGYGVFNGLPGARAFRRHLSEKATKPGASLDVLKTALAFVQDGAEERAAA